MRVSGPLTQKAKNEILTLSSQVARRTVKITATAEREREGREGWQSLKEREQWTPGAQRVGL